MSGSGQVRVCDFGLGPGAGFEMRPVCNSSASTYWNIHLESNREPADAKTRFLNNGVWLAFGYLLRKIYFSSTFLRKQKINVRI